MPKYNKNSKKSKKSGKKLIGKQKELDKNKNGRLDKGDFKRMGNAKKSKGKKKK